MMEKTTFNDREGMEWPLTLTIGNVQEIKQSTGVDIGDLQGGAMVKIASDPAKLGAMLWILCEKQAHLAKIEEEQFVDRLDGDSVDQAVDAIGGAIVNFTPAPMRGAVRNAMTAARKAQEAQGEVISEWVTGDDLQTKLIDQMRQEIKRSGL